LESGILVQYYYTLGGSGDDEYGPYLDRTNTLIVDRVFDTPPIAVYHEDIAKLEKAIEELEKIRESKVSEIRQAAKEIEDASNLRKQHEQLSQLDDFIAGKITHYVEFPYEGPRVIDFNDATCNCDKRQLKLLTLFGGSKGDLQWKLSYYHDGSGGSHTVIPVTSYEQATEVSKSHIIGKLRETMERPSQNTVKMADKWDVPVPDDYREQAKEEERRTLLKRLDEHKTYVAGIEKQLAELD
jgi:hypothetical protein